MIDLREGSTFHRESTEYLRRKVGRSTFEIRFFFRDKSFTMFYKGSPVLFLGKRITSDSVKKVREYFRDINSGKTREHIERVLSVDEDKRTEKILEEKVLIPLHDDRHSDEKMLRRPYSINIDRDKWFAK